MYVCMLQGPALFGCKKGYLKSHAELCVGRDRFKNSCVSPETSGFHTGFYAGGGGGDTFLG